jgi:hypothetical protein
MAKESCLGLMVEGILAISRMVRFMGRGPILGPMARSMKGIMSLARSLARESSRPRMGRSTMESGWTGSSMGRGSCSLQSGP